MAFVLLYHVPPLLLQIKVLLSALSSCPTVACAFALLHSVPLSGSWATERRHTACHNASTEPQRSACPLRLIIASRRAENSSLSQHWDLGIDREAPGQGVRAGSLSGTRLWSGRADPNLLTAPRLLSRCWACVRSIVCPPLGVCQEERCSTSDPRGHTHEPESAWHPGISLEMKVACARDCCREISAHGILHGRMPPEAFGSSLLAR